MQYYCYAAKGDYKRLSKTNKGSHCYICGLHIHVKAITKKDLNEKHEVLRKI